ncbi:ABC-type uncharacterised transport system, substrate-binding component, TM0202 type [Syntrophomonas zehnderi OL-4]|uniref:ABC-type uncharacterized transport system, substrate-binding component, TM0202 type n=1 Tax=Syntrophomonas zehnderi OL-4 TaxID=690567 RepID=A0A0E4GDE0_9FIRM|nr:MqnA/MqnD/SBP family protein [Syntrophomonas zehnderi]CFX45096.1 ABC-type uncharacterised transport system, substrate-binding component, TM0202 type [Syntrophomonas zehnderi OL-4]
MKINNKRITVLLCLVLIVALSGCGQKTDIESANNALPAKQSEDTVKLEDLKLTIGSAPGPVTYPLAQMAEKNSQIVLKPWQNGEQLTAMITAKEVQLCSTPMSNALLCYNKGLGVQLLSVTVWGMLYVMSTDDSIKNLSDLKGKEVALTGRGGIQDLIFRHLLIKNNINPDTDLTLTYLDMPEASARLADGQLKYAVLNEPQSSIAALNTKKNGRELFRVLDLTKEWNKLPGQEQARMPMAGIIVINDTGLTPAQAGGFEKIYIETADYVNKNSQEISPIVEKHVPTMKAQAVSESMKYARLKPEHGADCQAEIEAFFKELSQTAGLQAFGGKLPDAKFYYQFK